MTHDIFALTLIAAACAACAFVLSILAFYVADVLAESQRLAERDYGRQVERLARVHALKRRQGMAPNEFRAFLPYGIEALTGKPAGFADRDYL